MRAFGVLTAMQSAVRCAASVLVVRRREIEIMAFNTILADVHRILDEVTGAAARDAKAALGHLEAEAAKVHGAVTDLIAKAKADIEAAVAEAEPVVKAEAAKVIAQLEADAQTALAALLTHAV